jgi:3-methyladenine DNA glycosylase AlkC
MAEPLKNHFGSEIPRTIAEMIVAVYPAFPKAQFLRTSLKDYEPLALMSRGRHIAQALRRHLPSDYDQAIEILLASLGPLVPKQESDGGMAPFLYMPHTMFVQEYGLDHFEHSMRAQYELTQRFTAEFSIRPFLERYREATLARLTLWVSDPSPDVRRLVSEGTRPRLPWAPRLRAFQADPQPVLALLDLLKDDPDLYVRRSVANNLNNIGKDHPALLAQTAKKWMRNASEERRWLIRHALRSAVKRGEPGALHVLGAGHEAQVVVRQRSITPSRVKLGQSVTVAFELKNAQSKPQRVMVDFRIHFVKANGSATPKVFKLKMIELAPRARVFLKKTVSLKPMTTRTHYPGQHRLDILLNGRAKPLGTFELLAR